MISGQMPFGAEPCGRRKSGARALGGLGRGGIQNENEAGEGDQEGKQARKAACGTFEPVFPS